jgi:carbonic anhydrase
VASARAARVVVTELSKGATSQPAPRPQPSRTRAPANAPLVLAPRNDGIPVKQIAVVTCMDPRVNVLAALGLRSGDANVLRNAGGIVTDDVLRSLAVSQRVLGTREVIVVQHTDCRMQRIDAAEFRYELERAAGLPPPFQIGAFKDLDASVRASVRRIRDARWLPERDRVHGFVYDVQTHRLREVSER